MDGVDAALARLSGSAEKPRVRLLAFLTVPYPAGIRSRLLRLASGLPADTGRISALNFELGELFAQAALRVCRQARISPQRLSLVGSHGQTIFHQGRAAGRGINGERQPASTLQIGEPAVIAERTGSRVIADFRVADIAAGGQGAPLVPMADYLLLGRERHGVAALNIGGIANLTLIPARARPDQVFGFDAGPGNMVMDALVRRFTCGRKSYDAGGRLAARGHVIEPLLNELLTDPFFLRRPPKSAGREQFGEKYLKRYFLRKRHARFEDLLRTAAELTARTIAGAFERFVFPRVQVVRLIISGGGAHNRLLVGRLRDLLPQLEVHRSDRYGLPADAKEAIAFAVLADRTLHGLSGNLPAVTGARRALQPA